MILASIKKTKNKNKNKERQVLVIDSMYLDKKDSIIYM